MRLVDFTPFCMFIIAFACNETVDSFPPSGPSIPIAASDASSDGARVQETGLDATSFRDAMNDGFVPLLPDVSVTGKTLGNPSKMPQVIPAIGDGGAGLNAFDMSVSRCTGSPMPLKSWQHNIDLADYRANAALDFIDMGTSQTLTYKFVTPSAPMLGSFATEENTNVLTPGTMLGISTKPCDFDTAKLQAATRDSCYGLVGAVANSIVYEVTSAPTGPATCGLKPSSVYYLNFRFLKVSSGGYVDSCPIGTRCGATLGFK
jgi:hypothetical protein